VLSKVFFLNFLPQSFGKKENQFRFDNLRIFFQVVKLENQQTKSTICKKDGCQANHFTKILDGHHQFPSQPFVFFINLDVSVHHPMVSHVGFFLRQEHWTTDFMDSVVDFEENGTGAAVWEPDKRGGGVEVGWLVAMKEMVGFKVAWMLVEGELFVDFVTW